MCRKGEELLCLNPRTLGKLTFEIGYPYIKPSSSRINPNFYHHLTGFVASICYKGFQWVVPG